MAGPRRSASPATLTTKRRPAPALMPVTTSPARTGRLTFSARSPLILILPASINLAASVRVFTSLAHQSHLSSLCPSMAIPSVALWPAGGKIAAKFGKHGKGRRVGCARALFALDARRPRLALARGLRLPLAPPRRLGSRLIGLRVARILAL